MLEKEHGEGETDGGPMNHHSLKVAVANVCGEFSNALTTSLLKPTPAFQPPKPPFMHLWYTDEHLEHTNDNPCAKNLIAHIMRWRVEEGSGEDRRTRKRQTGRPKEDGRWKDDSR